MTFNEYLLEAEYKTKKFRFTNTGNQNINDMINGFLNAILFSTTHFSGKEIGSNYTVDKQTKVNAENICKLFYKKLATEDLYVDDAEYGEIGKLLCFTMAGEGSNFTDDVILWGKEKCSAFNKIAHSLGTISSWVSDSKNKIVTCIHYTK